MNERWSWVIRYLVVIAAALILAAAFGEMALFKATKLGKTGLNAARLVQFMGYGGALFVLWMLARRAADLLPGQDPRWNVLKSTLVPLTTLIVISAGQAVLLLLLGPLMNRDWQQIYNWVSAAIASGAGTLTGTLTVPTNSNGVAAFTDLSITGAIGDRTVVFTAPALASATSQTITLTNAPIPDTFEDFSTYTSKANMLLDPMGIWQTFEDINTGDLTLDTLVGFGTSKKSLRYDYRDRTGSASRCTDYTISRSLRLPNNGNIQEVWVEVVAKTSTNFTTQAPLAWGCTSDQGLKFLDGNVVPGDRFSIGLRTGRTPPSSGELWFGYPNNVTDPQGMVDFDVTAPVTDGNWHTYRCYWKISSGRPGAPNPDGRITCWVDGKKVVDEPGIRTTSTSGNTPPSQFYGLSLARNINQGPDRAQSLWWGQIKIYSTNPGW